MNLLFTILCGILYCIGLLFGWNYEQTSIYVCIYLWPILCTISTLPILWQSLKLIRKKTFLGIILTLMSTAYTSVYIYYTMEAIERYNINDPMAFTNCMVDLMSLAKYFGISYELLNILIYVVLFIVIILFNILLALFVRYVNKKVTNDIYYL